MTEMHINGSETGRVRLFHLDLPRGEVESFATQSPTGDWPLRDALGAAEMRAPFADLVSVDDLGDMLLSEYLVEAHGVTGADFDALRPQIDALGGHVVILPSQTFANTSQTLTIASPLRWVGTFGEVTADPRGPRLQSQSARGSAGGAPADPGSGASRSLKLILVAVAVVILLVLLFALR